MIENVYTMTKNRYLKYTTPKFYALPIFYIYIIIFVISLIVLKNFLNNGAEKQYKLLFSFLALTTFYLAFFHKWIVAISQYRFIRKKAFNGKPWECKVVCEDQNIKLYVNNELTNTISWDEITCLAEANTFVSLKQKLESEKIVMFDDSYIKGSRNELLNYVREKHSNIPIKKERFRYFR